MKPRVGIFSFSSCEGCQLQILNMENELLDIVGAIDLVTFREAMDPVARDYDVAFVEGSITRESEIPMLEEIRRKADVLVALGACATIGGVNAMKNKFSPEENLQEVYGDAGSEYYDTIPTRGIDEVVDVDYYIHGCPIDRTDFAQTVTSLLLGKRPYTPNFPVCVECRLKENVCVYDRDDDEICLGPVIRAGCSAVCPSFGSACIGCRGYVDQANFDSLIKVMVEHGIDEEEAKKKLRMFNTGNAKAQEVEA